MHRHCASTRASRTMRRGDECVRVVRGDAYVVERGAKDDDDDETARQRDEDIVIIVVCETSCELAEALSRAPRVARAFVDAAPDAFDVTLVRARCVDVVRETNAAVKRARVEFEPPRDVSVTRLDVDRARNAAIARMASCALVVVDVEARRGVDGTARAVTMAARARGSRVVVAYSPAIAAYFSAITAGDGVDFRWFEHCVRVHASDDAGEAENENENKNDDDGWGGAWPNAFADVGDCCKFHNYDRRGCSKRATGECAANHEMCMYCGANGAAGGVAHVARKCLMLAEDARIDVELTPALRDFRVPSLCERNRERLRTRGGTKAYIYVVGGRNRGLTVGVCERYDVVGNVWERAPTLVEPRGSHGACALGNGTILTIGGGGVRSNLASMETLDVANGDEAWTLRDDVVRARHAMSAASTSGRAYVVGGWYNGSEAIGDTDIYDGASNSWSKGASLNVPRRLHGVAATENGAVFVFGGWARGQSNDDGDGGECDSAERYDPSSNTWSMIAPLPAPACATACAIGDACYIFAWGTEGQKPTAASSGGFYHYDPHTNAYESLGQLPLERWFGFAVAAHEGVLYVIGGIVDGRWTGRAFAYHVAERAWEEIPSMSYVRRRTAALCVDVPCITSV